MDISPVQLILDTVESLIAGFIERLPQIGLALLALLVTLIVARVLRSVVASVMQGAKTRKSLIRLSANLIGITSWIFGIAIAVTIVFPSVTPAQLIAGLGLTTVAIGFAFKDVFENFLAGIIILFRKEMRIGDVIDCEGVDGKIDDISVRETHVRKMSGELVIVPNAYLFKNPLKIITDQDYTRQELIVGVDYGADLEQVNRILTDVLDSVDSVRSDPGYEVACIEFGGSSINFKCLWWTDSAPRAQRRSYHDVAFALKKAFDEAGIGIPFPQTTLSFRDETTPIKIATKARETENA